MPTGASGCRVWRVPGRCWSTCRASRVCATSIWSRSALGQSKISFLGYSNGSLLGAEYAQLFPGHVNRMVLDGAVNISGSPVSQARGFDRALGQLADWCVRQHCGLGTTREAVLGAITSLWDRLDSRPMASGGRAAHAVTRGRRCARGAIPR